MSSDCSHAYSNPSLSLTIGAIAVSEMTFRGLEIWDLGIMTRVGVRKLGETVGPGLEQLRGIGRVSTCVAAGRVCTCVAAPAHGLGTEGAGTRVCGYVNKDGRMIVYVLTNMHMSVWCELVWI